ncbi:nuclease-related domain-containing protein [Plebeiibacterium sediminum]|uniref:NERD domain-containing protein n=1 Tax=Plebeiibacterium sediminum TaxID=2992112 RepID=A0AAE3M9J1_9BACT|nr:nuclease-related domain-containing protein [Plebeiobacterium sediminum]MCW3789486.1 NERD domain-containing protein [Plebeiobacterium sediminum]
MDIWKYIIENKMDIIRIFIISVGLVICTKIFIKIRDLRLIKRVTSLNRGTKTERNLVLKLLKKGIPAQTIFHDLYVVKSNNKYSQIDVVVATTEGIIVFEVKDYSGWIYGNGNYSHWTKVMSYGKKKYRFYNPIKQNINHIEALKRQLKQFENIPFYSIIVFYGDCELKEINYVPNGTFLVKPSRIFDVLKLIRESNTPAPYTNKRNVVEILKKAVENGTNIDLQHKHAEDIIDLVGKDRIFD